MTFQHFPLDDLSRLLRKAFKKRDLFFARRLMEHIPEWLMSFWTASNKEGHQNLLFEYQTKMLKYYKK